MGMIIDANADHDANDTYALVSDGVVVNMIVASYNFCSENIIESFDYLVDVTVGEQSAAIGYTYDPINDSFAPPEEEEDPIDSLRQDIEQAMDDISIILSNSDGMSQEDIEEAFSQALANIESGFTENEALLFDTLASYVLGGG